MKACLLLVLAVVVVGAWAADPEPELLKVPIRRRFCNWRCASKGDFIECERDQALAGICGSDNRENCDNNTYCPESGSWHHSALCCSYTLVMEKARSV